MFMDLDQPPATAGGSDLSLHPKNFGEALDDAILDRTHFNFAAEQFLHRSHRLAFAGDYQIKITEIGVDVQRESVGRYPARDMHADRRDFAAWGVHAGPARDAKGFNSEILQRANQHFFQVAHEDRK